MLRSLSAALPSLLAAALATALAPATVHANDTLLPCIETDQPIVLAHRGASGYLPEHTLAAYALAIEMGADYVEPDLVMTKDGVLVARHENEIGGTTDVADKPEFAARKTTKLIDGVAIEGWFSEDFTFAELRTLRAKERIPQLRPDNQRFDVVFPVPSFQEVLDLVRGVNFRFHLQAKAAGSNARRCVGIYPETKHPSYFRGIGLPMERPLLRLLNRGTFFRTTDKVFIQSFEVGNLKMLRTMTSFPLVQLLSDTGKPWDFVVSGDPRTYADLAKPEGLAEIAGYAAGIGVNKNLMIPRTPSGMLGAPTTLIGDAHAAGLVVHGWTFRAENFFLPTDFQSPGGEPAARGNLAGEIATFLEQGMDGFFTDQADIGVRARDDFAN
ncbi:MAG: glycerophosphodiester phosphodiesterase [Rhodospirillales bacterium]|nr:glycerophosphodiester phosphodiesterase [Rhodospirillales bacterium]